MALRAVSGGTGRVRTGAKTQGGGATPPAPPPAGGGVPDPGVGFALLVDSAGNYLVDSNGAYLIGAA